MNNEVTILNADDKKQSTKTSGKLLLIIAAVCLVYIFIPEPSDVISGIPGKDRSHSVIGSVLEKRKTVWA